MKTGKNSIILLSILGLLSAWYWYSGFTIISQKSQNIYGFISLLIFAASLLFLRKKSEKSQILKPYIFIIGISALFILLFYCWNLIFRWYSDLSGFKGNIFRGAFYNFFSPFYGHFDKGTISGHLQIVIFSTIFLIFVFIFRKNLHQQSKTQIIIGLIALLIFSFGWNQSFEKTFLAFNCHYKTFALDLPKFDSVQYLFSHYTQEINYLSIHNSHYPPGNLLILKVEELYLPYLAKSLIFLATLIALFPLSKLMKLINFSKSERIISFIFYGTSGAILFFPSIDMSPLMIPFAITGIYLMLKSFQNQHFIYPICFAFVLAIYTFFSFISLVFCLFCAVIIIHKLIFKEISIKQILKLGIISLISFISIFWIIYLTLDFNIFECFISSLANEKALMSYSGIDNLSRYLIISTGNLLAYIGIIGMPTIGIIFYGLNNKKYSIPNQFKSLIYSLLTTIFIISFSNQFFLEVERIWIFLTPFCLIISGWFVAQLYKEEKYNLVFSIILASVIVLVLFGVYVDHCY